MFNTERLRLRAYLPTDGADIRAIFNDPLIMTFVKEDFIVPRGENYIPDTFVEIVNKAVMFCIIETLDKGEFVGFSLIRPPSPSMKNRHGIFGIILVPQFWDKGYGTEVTRFMVDHSFRCLGLHRLSLTVFEGNDRAIAVYKNVGFVEEGKQRKVNWVDGAWRDIHFMGILEDEWAALQRTNNSKKA